MYLSQLSLTNFRNYGRLELTLSEGETLLYGQNAQGKTNLLEAIYYMATTRSPHAEYDYQLLNWEASEAEEPIVVGRLVAQIQTQAGPQQLEMRLIQERNGRGRGKQGSFRREALLNRRKVRLMDLLGNLRAVLFLPQDVQMISGPPSERRRYVDMTLCQIDASYCRTLSNYNKVLEQRNALLKQIAEGSSNLDVLPIFTEKLITLGSQIFARRSKFMTELARETHQVHYEALTNGRETIRLQYMPRLTNNRSRRTEDLEGLVSLGEWLQENQGSLGTISERFAQELSQSHEHDLLRGSTNVGPHRDDWRFLLNGRSLGSYGSRGQQRTAILALKIAEINWMSTITGDKPVLLLDEVVAELDEQRREALLQTVDAADQALLTATDPAMFSHAFMKTATTLKVENGRVTNR